MRVLHARHDVDGPMALDANPHPSENEIREAISATCVAARGTRTSCAVRWAADHPRLSETEEVAAS